jgi:hypothetical protein
VKIRNELVIFILIVLIVPLLLISIQSAKSLEDSAEREMRVKAKSLAKECDAVFNAIEKQCSILGKEAEDIKNNPNNHKMLYEPNEYFTEPGGAYIATEPKNILDKSAVWVPNTVPITAEIKK